MKKINLSDEEYLFIANALNSMETTTQIALNSCIEKGDYEKYDRFYKYKKMCEKIEKKIRKALEE